MPQEAQNLYFHLCMNADDDGVVEAFTVMQMLGSSEDNIRILNAKNLVKPLNEDMVAYITDWNEHNLIRADRKVNSIYKNLLLQILPDVDIKEPRPRADTKALPRGNDAGRKLDVHWTAQVRLGKDRLDNTAAIAAPKADSFFQKTKKERKDDGFPMSLSEFVLMCRGSAYRHIRLIGEYVDEKKISCSTRGQWREVGMRNMRSARRLSPFNDDQLSNAIVRMKKDFDAMERKNGSAPKWGMETLEKYIEEGNSK